MDYILLYFRDHVIISVSMSLNVTVWKTTLHAIILGLNYISQMSQKLRHMWEMITYDHFFILLYIPLAGYCYRKQFNTVHLSRTNYEFHGTLK
jgi:hypothetical protein